MKVEGSGTAWALPFTASANGWTSKPFTCPSSLMSAATSYRPASSTRMNGSTSWPLTLLSWLTSPSWRNSTWWPSSLFHASNNPPPAATSRPFPRPERVQQPGSGYTSPPASLSSVSWYHPFVGYRLDHAASRPAPGRLDYSYARPAVCARGLSGGKPQSLHPAELANPARQTNRPIRRILASRAGTHL